MEVVEHYHHWNIRSLIVDDLDLSQIGLPLWGGKKDGRRRIMCFLIAMNNDYAFCGTQCEEE